MRGWWSGDHWRARFGVIPETWRQPIFQKPNRLHGSRHHCDSESSLRLAAFGNLVAIIAVAMIADRLLYHMAADMIPAGTFMVIGLGRKQERLKRAPDPALAI